jgi:alkaline phosphatase D
MAAGRNHTITRRAFVRGTLAAAGALPLTGAAAGLVGCGTPPLPPGLPDGLFALGVASGDPLPDGVVLWTRLAPAPVAGGGMPGVAVPVRWQVAEDEAFAAVVRQGTAVAHPRWGHSVHVDVRGLRPGAWYHYRFLVGDQSSPVARTRTAPAADAAGDRLRFLVGTCQSWRDGHWPAWAHAAGEDADLVVHLGDYIYEGGVNGGDNVRPHNSAEVRTLAEYRDRYGLYKGDPALQAAHAACPWVVTWDDHEVENNYAGLLPEAPEEAAAFPARRAAAYQAWWEHMPVRMRPPAGPDLRIHRSLDWGRLARFHVLDTRQYRSDQPCGQADLGPSCDARLDPARTLLGAEQEAWLAGGLGSSAATWDVLANQVVLTSMPLAGTIYNLDQWDGYGGARARLLDRLAAPDVANPVVLTGDIHAAGVGDVVDLDAHGPGAPAVATELVAPSISSRFDPALADAAEQLIAELDHVRWVDVRRRGYIRCDVTPGELVARYQMAESVLTPDAPVTTATTWSVTAGQVGAEQA